MKAIHNYFERNKGQLYVVVNIVKSKNESNSQPSVLIGEIGVGCCKYR